MRQVKATLTKKRLYWILLLVGSGLVTLLVFNSRLIEKYYSTGVYLLLAKTLRFLFGWLPISLGDIVYALLILFILAKTVWFVKGILHKMFSVQTYRRIIGQVVFFVLSFYILFMLFWGLNYNRLGIAHQLGFNVEEYSTADLDTLTSLMQSKLNYYAGFVTEAQRDSFDRKRLLFKEGSNAFKEASGKFSFLSYHPVSIKPSLFSYIENYLGFLGYYNPFTGEAIVNTKMPRMLEPFVTAHEIAHQLGYARENEANFVAYLAGSNSGSNVMQYSTYFYMYNYAIAELDRRDSIRAVAYRDALHPQCKKDYQEVREFYRLNKGPAQQTIAWVYDKYLRANGQKGGRKTYNQVVTWLVAYYKKYGKTAL